MFNDIAPSYDKLNHILSLNIDKGWRKKSVRQLVSKKPQNVLDIACGTGDFAIAMAQAGVRRIYGADISEGMLEVGRKKIAEHGFSLHTTADGIERGISLQIDDCEALSFDSNSMDAVTVAFGVRNFEHLQQGLNEMYRVLRPEGELYVLELSVPQNRVLLWGYKLYFLHVLPFFGGLVSGNKAAYKYLPISVLNFPKPDKFCAMLKNAGFKKIEARSYTFGLCRLFIGTK